jgi:hypothetical protein
MLYGKWRNCDAENTGGNTGQTGKTGASSTTDENPIRSNVDCDRTETVAARGGESF